MATTTSPKGVTVLEVAVHTSEPPRLHPIRRIRELWGVREILGNLIRKEVKVKYTSSVLGALWSLLNPVLYLAVFSLVFAVVLPNKIPNFPVYLLSGILAWNFFSNSLGLASRSVVDNANLVTKVYFRGRSCRSPRWAPPASTSGCRAWFCWSSWRPSATRSSARTYCSCPWRCSRCTRSRSRCRSGWPR